MKKILLAAIALTVTSGVALAQTATGPAAQSDNANKRAASGSMQSGTTGSAMKPDASQQGAPTGAAVGAKGTSTEPGKVKDGATR